VKHSLASLIKQKKGLRGLPADLLPFVLLSTKKTTVIKVSSSLFNFLFEFYSDRVGVDVALVFSLEGSVPVGFSNKYTNALSSSISLVAERFSSVVFCFVDVSLFKKPLFPIKQNPGFVVDSSVSFEGFLSALDRFGYVESDYVGGVGLFSVRGGVIDVFPFGSVVGYRVSFLDDIATVFLTSMAANSPSKKVASFVLREKPEKERVSLFSLSSAVDVVSYIDTVLTVSEGCFYSIFSYEVIDFQMFNKLKSSFPVEWVFVGFGPQGYLVGDSFLCVPSWFIKEYSVVPPPLVLDVGFLEFGCVYVHEDFGYCLLLGVEDIDGGERVCLKFSDGLVRLDVKFINKLSFFGKRGSVVLSFLKKPGVWKRKKRAAALFADQCVEELLLAYVKRKRAFREPYENQSDLIDLFVNSFSFIDTKDQSLAWRNILDDFSKKHPMNRLICGDVGFGKTELALRAAFVVVFNRGSVIVLAPTTLLAHQLFGCFVDRLSVFGVSVSLLDRTVSKNKKNNIISSFVNKKTDVLVATHAVLYYKKALSVCSLFIVDEEHRFGVKQKEKITTINPSVDLLSLSATPIPRTLQLALNNVKNISTIQTPPKQRKPIISSVYFYNLSLVCSIINKELSRGGQVYYVDNSVNNLRIAQKKIKKKLPFMSSGLVYSNLKDTLLLKTMNGFINNKINVLFSTTIIESGIDLKRVNTIIINNAHRFGLSQLYQLRGRVGRSFVQAYSFFLVPKNKKVWEGGAKRLKILLKYNSLGTGYKIAEEDLSLRGAGSPFGIKQSGDSGVGFEFFSRLVSLAFNRVNNGDFVPEVSVFHGFVPKSFILNDQERLFVYKKTLSVSSLFDLRSFKKNLRLFYGGWNKDVENLFKNQSLFILAKEKKIKSVFLSKGIVSCLFDPLFFKNFDIVINKTSSFFKKRELFFRFVETQDSLVVDFEFATQGGYGVIYSYLKGL